MVASKPMTASALELTRRAYATADGGDFDAMMADVVTHYRDFDEARVAVEQAAER